MYHTCTVVNSSIDIIDGCCMAVWGMEGGVGACVMKLHFCGMATMQPATTNHRTVTNTHNYMVLKTNKMQIN